MLMITPDELVPDPHEFVLRHGVPDTIAAWKALADGLLTNQSCVFHRNLERLRPLLRAERHYAPVLAGFEAIDRGRRVLEDRTAPAEARRAAEDLIWEGNVQLLEHEQRASVQPNLDGLSCAFARLFSIGSALSFEVRGLRDEVSYFTSFYYYALTRGIRQVLQAQAWPRITHFDDRWRWIVTCIVPRFRRLDVQTRLIDASLRRVFRRSA
jgi:hypothetical protein